MPSAVYTESTTLDEVRHDAVAGTVTVVWRDHVFKDGTEIDSARVAREKVYTAETKDQMIKDLGEDADKYSHLL